MEVVDGQRPACRVAADLVQAGEAVVAVERRVLDALRHHGRRRLLEADDECVVAALLEREQRREPRVQPCVGDGLTVEPVDRARVGIDIRPIDTERRERARKIETVVAADIREEPVHFRLERRARLLELRLLRDLREASRFSGQVAVELGERILGRGIDEQARQVVRELVARRPAHGPIAQLLAGLEDLLDPHALDARFPQPVEVSRRIREPVGMVDADSVHETLAHELDHLRMRRLEHLRVLHADAGEVADVEEAPYAARPPLDVEELRAAERIAPERVLVVARRHVVRDDVEHDAELGLAQGAKLGLAAELFRQVRWIDDVIAVRRLRAGLHRRGQIQMADAEIAEIGDELSRAAEVEVREELETVGAAEYGSGHRRKDEVLAATRRGNT